MALVQKKSKTQYNHLQKVYKENKDRLTSNIEELAEELENKVILREKKISPKELVKPVLIGLVLGLLGISGYVLTRFLP